MSTHDELKRASVQQAMGHPRHWLDDIVAKTQQYVDADRDTILEFVFADWPEGDEHDAWLAKASTDEIADWVVAGMR
jgi:hypothetical protein